MKAFFSAPTSTVTVVWKQLLHDVSYGYHGIGCRRRPYRVGTIDGLDMILDFETGGVGVDFGESESVFTLGVDMKTVVQRLFRGAYELMVPM